MYGVVLVLEDNKGCVGAESTLVVHGRDGGIGVDFVALEVEQAAGPRGGFAGVFYIMKDGVGIGVVDCYFLYFTLVIR